MLLYKEIVDEGCRPALFAATTSENVVTKGIQGQHVSFSSFLFIDPQYGTAMLMTLCWIVPDRKVTDPSKQAMDDELGGNLWRLSEQILKEKLGKLPYQSQLLGYFG